MLPGATESVQFRVQRNGRTFLTGPVQVHTYPATQNALTDPAEAERYRYAMLIDPDFRIRDDQNVLLDEPYCYLQEGDILVSPRFPGQDLAISSPRVSHGAFTFSSVKAYFMNEDTNPQGGQDNG